MKKIISILCVLAMIATCTLSFAACSKKNDKTVVGILQFGEFDALTQAYKGFLDGMKEAGYTEENTKFVLKSAAADVNNCPTGADALVNEGADIILAITTPSASAVKEKTTTIPVVITAVTDPAESKIVASNEKPGANITGTSDLTPVAAQIDLLKTILPEAQKVAVLYCSGESNSKIQFDLAKAAIEAKGMECVEKTVSAIDEVKSVIDTLKGAVDAIYIPADNTLAEGMKTVSTAATEAGLPIIGGEVGMVKDGCLATKGISYYNLGKQTAKMAVEILNGKKPADMAIQYTPEEDLELAVNVAVAEALGITVPESILANAQKVGK